MLQSGEERDVLLEPKHLEEFWRSRIGALSYEVFEVAYLDAGYRLLRDGVERLEEGTTDRATIYPREVIEAALRRGAAAIVVAHNHPGGGVAPSAEDKLITRAIGLAAITVNLRVVDHLIVTADEVFSFREAGLL